MSLFLKWLIEKVFYILTIHICSRIKGVDCLRVEKKVLFSFLNRLTFFMELKKKKKHLWNALILVPIKNALNSKMQ